MNDKIKSITENDVCITTFNITMNAVDNVIRSDTYNVTLNVTKTVIWISLQDICYE